MTFLSKRIIFATILIVCFTGFVHGLFTYIQYKDIWLKNLQNTHQSFISIANENKESFRANALLGQQNAINMLESKIKADYKLNSVKLSCHAHSPSNKRKNNQLIFSDNTVTFMAIFAMPNGSCDLGLSKNYLSLVQTKEFQNQMFLIIMLTIFMMTLVTISIHWLIKKYFSNPIGQVFSMIEKLSNNQLDMDYQKTYSDLDNVLEKLKLLGITIKKDRKELENQSRLASIGQTTSMLAHDVRRPFTLIKALLGMMEDIKNDPSFLEQSQKDIEKAITHVEAMIDDIIDFSKNVSLQTRPCSVISMLDFSIRQNAQNYKDRQIDFHYQFKNKYKPLVDEERLARVFTNIIANAIEAITVIGKKDSGNIFIHTEDLTATNIHGETKNWVQVAIGNDGPVFDEGDIPKIFESFFTKGKNKGTGLGLASVQKLIHLHGGSASAHNLSNGRGVEFVIKVPASDVPEEITIEMPPRKMNEIFVVDLAHDQALIHRYINDITQKQESIKVLLLEDETLYQAAVRNIINTVPSLHKLVILYDAVEVDDALELVKTENITHAIVDIDLRKNKNGFDFLTAAKEMFPNLKSMVHSNRCIQDDKDKATDLGAYSFVPKPLNLEHLMNFLKENDNTDKNKTNVTNLWNSLPVPPIAQSDDNDKDNILSTSHTPITYVYIDDERLFLKAWRKEAEKAGIHLLTFSTSDEFREQIQLKKINKNAMIYIDRELGDDQIKGEVFAKELYEMGYLNLYLATGHNADKFYELPWLKGVQGKIPPWRNP